MDILHVIAFLLMVISHGSEGFVSQLYTNNPKVCILNNPLNNMDFPNYSRTFV